MINSINSIANTKVKLKDLKSRINSFLFIGIDAAHRRFIKKIISKTLSERQISADPKISEYIIKNVDESMKKCLNFLEI